MQGSCSNSALFWAPEKARVKQPLLILFPALKHRDPPDGRVYVATGPLGQVPWCWLDGTGKVIRQRLRIVLLGSLTMNRTTTLFSFSLAEKENNDALHFILECTSCAISTCYPSFTWSMGKFMSDGDPAMYNAAKRVWVAIVWLRCYWHAQRAMPKALKKIAGPLHPRGSPRSHPEHASRLEHTRFQS